MSGCGPEGEPEPQLPPSSWLLFVLVIVATDGVVLGLTWLGLRWWEQ